MEIKKLLIFFTAFLAGSLACAAPYAFPVPYVDQQHTEIFFKDLPGSGTIKILTVAGDEVTQLDIAPGEIIKSWNVTNSAGRKIATGVYFFVIDAGGGKTVGKLVVIR